MNLLPPVPGTIKIKSCFRSPGRPNHQGIDIDVPSGTDVSSGAPGTIVRASEHPEFGNVVIVDNGVIDGQRTYTLYAHLSAYGEGVQAGATVTAGQIIGQSGGAKGAPGAGRSSGPHLHFEVIQSKDEGAINWSPSGASTGVNGSQGRVDPTTAIQGPVALPQNCPNPGVPGVKGKVGTASKTRSPVVLDLNGDGVGTTGVTDGAYFDHDANGFAEQTAWVAPEDGLLVRDLDGNGTIDTGRELFGSETSLANGQKAANGYAALAELDDNRDGRIDAQDSAWSTLKIWKDTDGDGYSLPEELLSLAEAGVQSLNVAYATAGQTDDNGNIIQQTGTFTKTDGNVGVSADVWFQVDNTYTIPAEWLEETDAIAALPDLEGYGNVHNLHQAMLRDSSGRLQSLVGQFINETDPASRFFVAQEG